MAKKYNPYKIFKLFLWQSILSPENLTPTKLPKSNVSSHQILSIIESGLITLYERYADTNQMDSLDLLIKLMEEHGTASGIKSFRKSLQDTILLGKCLPAEMPAQAESGLKAKGFEFGEVIPQGHFVQIKLPKFWHIRELPCLRNPDHYITPTGLFNREGNLMAIMENHWYLHGAEPTLTWCLRTE